MTINEYKELIKQYNPIQEHSPASAYRLHKYAELLSYHGLSADAAVAQLQADHMVGQQGFNLDPVPVKKYTPWNNAAEYLKEMTAFVFVGLVIISVVAYAGFLVKIAIKAV